MWSILKFNHSRQATNLKTYLRRALPLYITKEIATIQRHDHWIQRKLFSRSIALYPKKDL